MNKFTPKQERGIELMASGSVDVPGMATDAGVHVATVYRWMKMPGFMERVIARSRELLKAKLPEVYKSLGDASAKGSYNHTKIMLDHIEKLEDIKAGVTSVTFTWLPPTDTEKEQDG